MNPIEVTVNFNYNGKLCLDKEVFFTPCVPRVDEFYYVQYWACPIYRVSWWVFQGVPKADIYVDVSETKIEWRTI